MKKSILSAFLSIVLLSLPLAAGELNSVKKKDVTKKNETTQEEEKVRIHIGSRINMGGDSSNSQSAIRNLKFFSWGRGRP